MFIYGKNPVLEVLTSDKDIIYVYFKKGSSQKKIDDVIELCKEKNVKFAFKEGLFFDKNFPDVNHQGIAIEVNDFVKISNDLEEFLDKINKETKRIVILDSITDPHNFGAILRSACFFGVDGVIFNKDNSAKIDGVVAKTSSGSISHLNLFPATNLTQTIKELKKEEFWIYAGDMDGEKILSQTKFDKFSVLVLGSEGKGIRKLVKENCDFVIKIPGSGKIDSLNVSVSSGIFFL